MDFNKTVDLIIKDLEEAREIIDDLKNYPGIPAIQVELAKSKCKNAAEVISLFKNLQNTAQAEIKKESFFSEPVKKKVPEKKVTESTTPYAGSPKPEARRPMPVSDDKEPPRTTKKIPESAIVADTFDNLPDSLNETLGNLRDDDNVPDYLKSKPLTNLSQAIGVNDKFLFIRELFNGNPDSYNQAISNLDEAKSLADAKVLMASYTGDKSETEASQQLFELVKRKFPGDE